MSECDYYRLDLAGYFTLTRDSPIMGRSRPRTTAKEIGSDAGAAPCAGAATAAPPPPMTTVMDTCDVGAGADVSPLPPSFTVAASAAASSGGARRKRLRGRQLSDLDTVKELFSQLSDVDQAAFFYDVLPDSDIAGECISAGVEYGEYDVAVSNHILNGGCVDAVRKPVSSKPHSRAPPVELLHV